MINTRKIVKPEGKAVDEFEARVAQELFNIEVRVCGPHTHGVARTLVTAVVGAHLASWWPARALPGLRLCVPPPVLGWCAV